jgi:hypothetical protein
MRTAKIIKQQPTKIKAAFFWYSITSKVFIASKVRLKLIPSTKLIWIVDYLACKAKAPGVYSKPRRLSKPRLGGICYAAHKPDYRNEIHHQYFVDSVFPPAEIRLVDHSTFSLPSMPHLQNFL